MDRALLLQHDRPDIQRAVLTWATGASTVQEAGPAARSQSSPFQRGGSLVSSTPLSLVCLWTSAVTPESLKTHQIPLKSHFSF